MFFKKSIFLDNTSIIQTGVHHHYFYHTSFIIVLKKSICLRALCVFFVVCFCFVLF